MHAEQASGQGPLRPGTSCPCATLLSEQLQTLGFHKMLWRLSATESGRLDGIIWGCCLRASSICAASLCPSLSRPAHLWMSCVNVTHHASNAWQRVCTVLAFSILRPAPGRRCCRGAAGCILHFRPCRQRRGEACVDGLPVCAATGGSLLSACGSRRKGAGAHHHYEVFQCPAHHPAPRADCSVTRMTSMSTDGVRSARISEPKAGHSPAIVPSSKLSGPTALTKTAPG